MLLIYENYFQTYLKLEKWILQNYYNYETNFSNLIKNQIIKLNKVNSETEDIICGYSEQHLNSSLKDLTGNYVNFEIIKSDLFITYKEAVTTK